MSGQTLNDRLTAARHALAGQGLARIVCKATTEEVIGPKKKHLDYLLHCTNEPNVSIPQLANLLIERTQNTSWVVVFKALITVHHLMCYGNERFTQYLASSNCTFQLGCFLDKVGVQSYDMSTFIRRYAKYLNEKAVSYRTVAFDFCKCKRGKEDGILRQMFVEQLLKTLPALQAQLDSLLEFDCSTNDLCNGVVNACFMLLFRDLVRLFACYNDGIINLLGKYFEMNKKHARDALDIYKKFLIRMDRVAEFLKVAENIGIDKGDIPDLTKAPSSLLEALEQHLATLEGRKGSTSAASVAASAGEGSPQTEVNGDGWKIVDDSTRKAVEEEAEIMSQLKFDHDSPLLWEQPAWEDSERRLKEMSSGELTSPPTASVKTNPFLASPCDPQPQSGSTPISNQNILDLFGAPPPVADTSPLGDKHAGNDLLGLGNNLSGNPFADSLFGSQPQMQLSPQQKEQDSFVASFTNGFTTSNDAFASDASFAAAFGESPTSAAEKDTTKLSLPMMEPFGGRSASPSPTAELMRGAGATPILSHVPEGSFGEATDSAEEAPVTTSASQSEAADFIWGGGGTTASSTPTAVITTGVSEDLFGAAFEPTPSAAAVTTTTVPTAVVTPLPVQQPPEPVADRIDLFGFEADNDVPDQPMSAQPCPAPPPSPFGGFDIGIAAGGPDLRAQAIANAVGVALPMQAQSISQPKPSSGLEDLNFAIHQAMQPRQSPVLAASPISSVQGSFPPGYNFPPGGMQPMSVGISGIPMATGVAPMQGAGTPTGRSSTPGFGTPPSGMSSPAKAFGAPMPGTFDAFGDTLQPQASVGKPVNVDNKTPSSSILKGDLDSTLASLASNLDINGPKQVLKKTSGHQWGSPKPPVKVAGPPGTWTAPASVVPVGAGGQQVPANMAWSASPQHGYQQMQGVPPGQWGGGMMGSAFPQQQPQHAMYTQQQQYMGVVRPNMASMGAQAPPQGVYGGTFMSQTAPMMQQQTQPVSAPQANDPFGAL